MDDFLARRCAELKWETDAHLLAKAFGWIENVADELRHIGLSESLIVRALRAEADDIEHKAAWRQEQQAELELQAATTCRAKYEQAMAEKRRTPPPHSIVE